MGKGSDGEREVVNRLEDELGWRSIRAPGSGGGTDRERPDILAGRDGRVVCLEVKTSGGRPVYVTKDEANDLVDFASDFGAEAYIAVRFKSRSLRDTTVYCSPINMMHETEKSYRAKYEDCVEKPHWKPLSVICE